MVLVLVVPLVDWRLQRRNLNDEVQLSDAAWTAVAYGDERQAVASCWRPTVGVRLRPPVPAAAVVVRQQDGAA